MNILTQTPYATPNDKMNKVKIIWSMNGWVCMINFGYKNKFWKRLGIIPFENLTPHLLSNTKVRIYNS
jgi:hypothetical protein